MIKDMNAEEIREWVGQKHYGFSLEMEDPDLDQFLRWVEENTPPRSSSVYSWMQVRDASDEQVLQWYLQFLLDGGEAK